MEHKLSSISMPMGGISHTNNAVMICRTAKAVSTSNTKKSQSKDQTATATSRAAKNSGFGFNKTLSDGLTLVEHLMAGAFATVMAVGIMHPMDTVKTFMQKAMPNVPNAQRPNLVQALQGIVKEGGAAGLFSGLVPNLCGQAPAGAIKFAAFETLTQFFRPKFEKKWQSVVEFSCAAMAFVICSVVLVPGELLKQRMQAGVYKNFLVGIKEIAREEGFRGFYTGYTPLLVRDVPYTMFEFGLYNAFKTSLKKALKKEKLASQEELMMGAIAGACTGFLSTPLDVVKTKMMTQAKLDPALRYKNLIDALVRVSREEGMSGLFRGASARVIWLMPFTAIFFGVHEFSKRRLLQRKGLAKRTASLAVKPQHPCMQ